jgi:hypothetical protein
MDIKNKCKCKKKEKIETMSYRVTLIDGSCGGKIKCICAKCKKII